MGKHLQFNKIMFILIAFFCGMQMGWAYEPDFSKKCAFNACSTISPITIPNSVTSIGNGWCSFTNLQDDSCAVVASANPTDGGSVSGTGNYYSGEICTLTATANTGYTFANWTENDSIVSTDNIFSFVVTENHQLVANFNQITNHWTPVTGTSGSMTILGIVKIDGVEPYADYLEVGAFSGEECRGSALPQFVSDYCIYSLSVVGNTNGDTITFRLYDHHLNQELDLYCTNELTFVDGEYYGIETFYEINFISRMQIAATADPTEGGTVDGAGEYFPGMSCTLTATANTGYTFINWTIGDNVVSTDATYTFTVTEAADYVAHFSLNSYDITATADPEEGGTLNGAGTYYHFDTCTLIATANIGYTFINWTLGGEEVTTEPTYSFQVSDSANYVAHFSLNSYDITAIADPDEGGMVSGAGTYYHFDTCTLMATAYTGYTFQNWTLNDEVVSTDTVYTFMVSDSANYVAHFSLNSYTIAAMANPEEGGSVSGAGTYNHFATCTLTATPADNFIFNSWVVDGEIVSTETTYTFEVSGPVTVTAVFDLVQVNNLDEGWTWWSASVELNDIEGLEMLENSLGELGLIIKTQNAYVQYFPSLNQWTGTLTQLHNEQGYKVKVSGDCTATMIGPKVYPSDHPIAIQHNWNWIGYPSTEALYVTDAMANFQPENGDIIKSQGSFATYYTELGWVPATFSLNPGNTFLFFSNSEQGKSLTFGNGGRTVVEQNDERHWSYNPHAFADNLCLTAVVTLDGEEQHSETLELGAFVDGECRGSAKLLYIEPLDRYFALMTIAGLEDEQVSFALFDEANGLVSNDSPTQLSFSVNAIIGEFDDPFVVHFGDLTSLSEQAMHLGMYPNPVNCNETFRILIPQEETVAELTIVNTLGSVVRHESGAFNRPVVEGLPVSGVYLVRVVCKSGNVYLNRLVVK